MKKVFFNTVLLVLVCTVCWGRSVRERRFPAPGFPDGLIFYANYNGYVDADYSQGANTATFAASRDATHPATYFDSSGVMQLTTTSNAPRYNAGYYDTTGFHAFSKTGVMIEGASTNRVSYTQVFENAAWTKTDCTANDDEVVSVDGNTNAASLTATAGNATLTQAYVDAVAGIYTASCWIKRKTGTGVINLRANTGDAYTAITGSVLTTTWTRVQVSSSSLANPTFDLQLVTDTDAVYIWGAQLEKIPFATSYIPQTDTDLTRNAETLKYETAGNRSASVESVVIKMAPGFPSSVAGDKNFIDTDTKRRVSGFGAGTTINAYANATDSIACTVGNITHAAWTAHTEMTWGINYQHLSPYIAGYSDGVASGTNETTDDFTTNAWGTYFWVGSDNTPTYFLNGTIFEIAFWDRVLNASEMKFLHDEDWEELDAEYGHYYGD